MIFFACSNDTKLEQRVKSKFQVIRKKHIYKNQWTFWKEINKANIFFSLKDKRKKKSISLPNLKLIINSCKMSSASSSVRALALEYKSLQVSDSTKENFWKIICEKKWEENFMNVPLCTNLNFYIYFQNF